MLVLAGMVHRRKYAQMASEPPTTGAEVCHSMLSQ